MGTIVLVLGAWIASGDSAKDWPAFRGPYGNGTTDAKNVPLSWSSTRNVEWHAPLPRPGNSSPVVAGENVFVTCAEDEQGRRRSLHCFDRATGEQRWVRTVDFAKVMPTHDTNPYCASTPAVAGDRVVAWHGSAGLFCYDLEGKELWSRDLGEFSHIWGYASSPVPYEGRVFLNCGPGKRIFLAAIDLQDGKTAWEAQEPQDGDGEKRTSGQWMGSWTTPIVVSINGRDQVVCSMPTRVNGYDPRTGELLWSCEGLRGNRGDLAYSSPVVSEGVCVAIGGFSGPGIGFRLGGSGNLTETRLWRIEQNPQSIGSGVIVAGRFYRPNAAEKAIECVDPLSGKVVWSDRGEGSTWGSMVLAEGRIYVTSQSGTTVVFEPHPEKFVPLATNRLSGADRSNATPAICDGQVFLRTASGIYCIEESAGN